jgi:hypothetical protein
MVKNQFTQLAILLCLVMSASGCSMLKKIWGEAPPARETVKITGNTMPNFTLVFGDDDQAAIATLAKWKSSILDSFSQIQGERSGYLSSDDVKTLIRAGFLSLDARQDVSIQRALNVMELLGYKDGINANNVSALFDWIKTNRIQARTFYQTFVATDNQHVLNWGSKDIVSLINVFGTLVALSGDEKIESAHMAELITPWFPENYPHAKAGLKSGIDLGIAFFASFCGDRVDNQNWNGKKVGQCLHDLTDHFDGEGPIFDFIFGHYNPTQNRAKLSESAAKLTLSVNSWLTGHHHPLFPTAKVSAFSAAIDIPAPYAFMDLTAWIPKLNAASTADGFSPDFFIDLARIVQTWTLTTMGATEQNADCTLNNWKDCPFTGTFQPLDKLYSEEYATLIQRKTVGLVSKISLYQTLAGFLMEKMDTDHNGTLTDDIKDLINLVVRLLDTNGYAQNVVSRLMEKPFDPSTMEDSLHSIHRQGLSELAAFASDILPERGQDRRTLLQKLESEIFSSENTQSYALDQLGITAFLYSNDLIGNLRDDYLAHYNLPVRVSGPLQFIQRRQVIESLPRILHDHFPKIYDECVQWGFERTCGVVFTQVLPNANVATGEIETYEMDIISLTSLLLESVMNRCDRNHDDRLSTSMFDGFDEKHCVISATSALAERLMRANIVDESRTAEKWMTLVRRVPLIRWAARGAISRGTLSGILWRTLPPFSFFSGAATLGSIMSIGAEFMSSEGVKAIENHTTGPVDSPGDELLYGNQLTDHYLVSDNAASR